MLSQRQISACNCNCRNGPPIAVTIHPTAAYNPALPFHLYGTYPSYHDILVSTATTVSCRLSGQELAHERKCSSHERDRERPRERERERERERGLEIDRDREAGKETERKERVSSSFSQREY